MPQVFLEAVGPDIDLNLIESQNEYQLKPYQVKQHELPAAETRDLIFEQAGLSAYITDLDQLDLDLIYLNIQQLEIKQLEIKYSHFPRHILLATRHLIHRNSLQKRRREK